MIESLSAMENDFSRVWGWVLCMGFGVGTGVVARTMMIRMCLVQCMVLILSICEMVWYSVWIVIG